MGNLLPFAQKFYASSGDASCARGSHLLREPLIFRASRLCRARGAHLVREPLAHSLFVIFSLREALAHDPSRSSRVRAARARLEPFFSPSRHWRGAATVRAEREQRLLRSSLLLTKRRHYVYSSANRDAREADSLRFASGAPGGGPQGGFFDIRWTHEVRRARGGARRSWGSCGLAALAAGYSAALVCWITS